MLNAIFNLEYSPEPNKWEKSGRNNHVLILCITKSFQKLLSEQEALWLRFRVGEILCATESYCSSALMKLYLQICHSRRPKKEKERKVQNRRKGTTRK